jgi:tetratricopeptide (TPR) repeat protein
VLATLGAYWPALGADFVWDDDYNVTGNHNMHDLAGLVRIWTERPETYQYYPLTHTTFWIERRLWGTWAPAYHLANVLLHALGAVLLWTLLRRLAVPGALLGAGAFALHPVNVESVAWVTERRNVLCGVLALAATLSYLRFADARAGGATGRTRVRFWALALITFACALLAKTAIVPLPIVLLALVAWRAQRLHLDDLKPLLPFFGLSAAFGLLTVWLEIGHLGAGTDWDLTAAGRLIVAGRAAWFYTWKLLWPARLAFFYPRWEIDPRDVLSYLWPLAAASVPVLLWAARARLGTGPVVGLLCYGALLAPVLGFIDVYFFTHAFVQDHFTYFASMALLPLVAAAATTAFRHRRIPARAGVALALLLLLALGALSWRRARAFENWETLFRDSLATHPDSWGAHHNLGNWLAVRQGRAAEGLGHLEQALRLYARAAERAGGPPELEHARRLRLAGLRYSIAGALIQLGRLDEAAEHCEWMLREAPDSVRAHHRMAEARLKQGRMQEAADHLQQAVRAAPDSAELHADLARAHSMLGLQEQALADLQEALRLRPGYFLAQHRLGLVLLASNRPADAVQAFEGAIAAEPTFAEAQRGLSQALRALGDEAGAQRALARYAELARRPGAREPAPARLSE